MFRSFGFFVFEHEEEGGAGMECCVVEVEISNVWHVHLERLVEVSSLLLVVLCS